MNNRGHPDVNNALVEQYKGKIADTIFQILGLWFIILWILKLVYNTHSLSIKKSQSQKTCI